MTLRSASSRRAPLALTTALVIACGLALTAVPVAQATQIHGLSTSFSLPNGGTPLELAINQSTGKVYATVDNALVVDVFEASGVPDPTHPKLTQADGTTPYNFAFPYGIAVDNTVAGPDHGDIYVADAGAGAVLQFNPSGARTAQAPITAADVPAEGTLQSGGLPAVVNNGGLGPAGLTVAPNGDVYVSDQSNNVVDIFEPSGIFVAQIGAGYLGGPYGLALDSHGNLYVAEYGPGVIELDSTGACVNSCTQIGGASLGVATDAEDHVYNDETNTVTEFNSSAEPIGSFGSFSFGRGLAVNDASGDVYVADEPAGKIDVFEPLTVPTVSSEPAANPGPTVALIGHVDPDTAHGGEPVTSCHFEYGYEQANIYNLGNLPCLNAEGNEVGTPTSPIETPVDVHVDATGLVALTTYHYRLVASGSNPKNTGSTGDRSIAAFLPGEPSIGDTYVSNQTTTAVTLNAQINTGYGPTAFRFQYGPTTTYGSTAPISKPLETAGEPSNDGDSLRLGTAAVEGLSPGTTYHYRVVAFNFAGSTHGPDQTFTTLAQAVVGGGGAASIMAPTPVATTAPGKQCRKGFVERHGKCVKKVRRKAKHHKVKAKHHKTKHHKRGGTR